MLTAYRFEHGGGTVAFDPLAPAIEGVSALQGLRQFYPLAYKKYHREQSAASARKTRHRQQNRAPPEATHFLRYIDLTDNDWAERLASSTYLMKRWAAALRIGLRTE